MEKQWTTVSETVRKAQHDARGLISPSKEDVRKNRRIAMALASTGVFLILIGAAPFLFGENDSSDYAAFLGQDPEVAINAAPAEGDTVGVPSDGLSDGLLDFGDEPETFDIPAASPTPEITGAPVDTSVPVIPSMPVAPPSGIITPEATDPAYPVATESALPIVDDPLAEVLPTPVPMETPTPLPTETPLPIDTTTPTPLPEVTPIVEATPPAEEVVTETVEFPINVHVGSSSQPVDYSQLEMGGDDAHLAAPAQPDTGAPLLPVLAFSGAAAAFWRHRKNKQNQ